MRAARVAASMVWLVSMPATAGQRAAPATRLNLVTIVSAADHTSVVVQADGELGPPEIGVAKAPARVYLDFSSVLPSRQGAVSPENPVVRRVRVALHSDSPRVTRVVVDLVREAAYRVEPSPLDPTRFVITFATSANPVAVAKTDAPQPRKPTVAGTPDAPETRSKPAVRATPDAPPVGAAAVIARLERLRPLLKAIDERNVQPGVNLQVAATELDSIAAAAASIKPSGRNAAVKDRLVQACGLARQAVRARMESEASGNAALGSNAVSAAAGALILLDSTRAALGLPPASPGS